MVWGQKYFLGQNNFLVNFLGSKNYWVKKIFGSKKVNGESQRIKKLPVGRSLPEFSNKSRWRAEICGELQKSQRGAEIPGVSRKSLEKLAHRKTEIGVSSYYVKEIICEIKQPKKPTNSRGGIKLADDDFKMSKKQFSKY